MRHILILGAGRSAASLIRYLIDHAGEQEWRITVADQQASHAERAVAGAGDAAQGVALDATDPAARAALIDGHDLVISMLPAFLHMDVVKDCVRLRKHVITPSYVPDALWAMERDVREAGLIVLNEMGVDPGIDHMSAMRILDRLRSEGERLESFESYTGGLVAPESDDNPWGYKFSWNPRNVVLAGSGGAAKFIEDGCTRYLPYHRLFRRTQRVDVPGWGTYDGYANRDSLRYRKAYGIEDIPTLLRGTLRKEGFCAAWDAFVQLGCTDDGYTMELPPDATWADYLSSFLPAGGEGDLRDLLAAELGLDPQGAVMAKLDWLGLFGDGLVGAGQRSPAAHLQALLESRWRLGPDDKDLVVMWHRFRHTGRRGRVELRSSMAVVGRDTTYTAMALTVGLPIAMACKLVLNGHIADRGVLLPLKPGIYDPILDELEEHGVCFTEEERQV